MSRKSSAQQYKGFDCHIHVTVSAKQRAKLVAKAERSGVPISVVVRGMIDQATLAGEVKK